ncbi:MAG: 50S ribosomal protein L3 [Thermodesulfobacteriota bacterium]
MPKRIGILGKKIGMTRMYDQHGNAIAVTVLQAGPCTILQKKTTATDGYNAVQVGFSPKKEARLSKPMAGHVKAAGKGGFYHIKEFRTSEPDKYEVGQELMVGDLFNVGGIVDISGKTKGRGFQGVVKRHGFKGGKMTHGSMFHRAPGSIGACAWPSRVIKGKKMPGHMGDEMVTKRNVIIIDVRTDDNLLIVKGSLPGPNNGILQIFTK